MEEAGRQLMVMLSPEELDMLIQARASKMVEQQQKAQAERIAQQATSASGGRAAPEDRPEHLSIWGQNKGPTGTQVEAPFAPIPFHRTLFETPSEGAQANLDRGSSSDEAPIYDIRKGKAPRMESSPERINRQFSEAILRDPLLRHYTAPTIGELKNAGATYQRLMNKVFREQIGRNLEWDGECDRAFEDLKAYLNSLPVLAKPNIGEPLRIYLSSTEHVVGSALVKEDGEEQPVYFLSHILKDAESRYTGLEKLAFALVLAARRLRPYFLAHTIIVMTNCPLGRVLLNQEAFGRLIKWTTELSKFNIQYQTHSTIKSQSLEDFVTEVQNPEPEALWKVFVDRSSTRLGSGIGILLLSPQEERMHLSVRLDYRATNNEAECEDLIVGLKAARHVGADRVILYSDSQLAAQQLSGTFEINNARLKLYAEAFEKLKPNFREVVIQKIPRTENQATDELAKLANSITPVVIQQLIEQVSLVAHIDKMERLTFPSDWRTAIVEFLRSGVTPSNRGEAQLLRRRAGRFTLIGDQLYKKAFSRPLLKCVSSEDAKYILEEVHQGTCGGHPGGRSLARKILLAGYFWPTLHEDAGRTVAACLSCQKYHSFSHRPVEEMKTSTVSCPFDQ
ncbi:uncharacterized protein LOC122035045 [Zingiber officinale]|uniref:uncharacterized protein LOC122035045 n=1 Tax=Zingiber officinale TaxID=94328 RepID=UPI001C4D7839|nr:uncharacterized protein LOC122035045 [Zingiber officinale]